MTRTALLSLPVFLFASSAMALVPMPADAGVDAGNGQGRPAPMMDAAGEPMAPDSGPVIAMDATPGGSDGGGYPDTGCTDGACELVLPDWDGGVWDTGPVDTGQRRRRQASSDTGNDTPPEDAGFGCSATGGASALLWLLPLFARRRRR